MKKYPILVILFATSMIFAADGEQRSNCLMDPLLHVMQTPQKGFVWLGNQEFHQDCDASLEHKWDRFSSQTYDLCVSAEGPFGSGRYWTVTVGVAENQKKNPDRGFCLSTSTVGWRTLQRFDELPLPWIADLNKDGKPELLIWTSFPLHEETSMAEFGLMAWVYQLDSNGKFTIDWSLSRQMAGEIAAAYRRPLEQTNQGLQFLRHKLASALEAFALGACKTKIVKMGFVQEVLYKSAHL